MVLVSRGVRLTTTPIFHHGRLVLARRSLSVRLVIPMGLWYGGHSNGAPSDQPADGGVSLWFGCDDAVLMV